MHDVRPQAEWPRHSTIQRTSANRFALVLALAASATLSSWTARACDNATDRWVGGAYNFWHGTLGRADFCNNASVGPDRAAAANCAWNYTVNQFGPPPDPSCARSALEAHGAATLDRFVETWRVAVGADCSQSTIDHFYNYWHGALGKAEYCNNAAIGPDREKAKNCAFQALVRDMGVSPSSCLRDAIANTPQGGVALDTFVEKWRVASGADCSQSTIDHFYNYWHGALGKAEYCNNAAVGPDRQKAKDCAFQALRDLGVSENSCLRDAIANTPQGAAALDAFVEKWRIASGADCSQSTIDHFYNYWHGALGKEGYCNNASIGPDREKAKDCAFQALVRDLGVMPTSCLRDAIANSPNGSATLDTFVEKWRTASGSDCSQATINFWFNYWHGALGKEEVCNNASVGADLEAAKDCAFRALVDKGVSPTSCLREAIADSPEGKADLDAFVRKWIARQSLAPAGSIAANMKSLTPPAENSCNPATAFQETLFPPKGVLDWTPTTPVQGNVTAVGIALPSTLVFDATKHFTDALGANEGRLRADLRAAAKAADPVRSLCLSAKALARDDTVLGRAFADLSVTGRRSFQKFRELRPKNGNLAGCTNNAGAIDTALNRAYNVANAIRFGKSPDRRRLGWIAVSGEDDLPHRPVNVPAAEFPQYDVTITVPVRSYDGLPAARPIDVKTRYMIAHPPPAGLGRPPRNAGRTIPADPVPTLDSDAEVILFIPGMDSRLEEALGLTHALHALAARERKKYTVISLDLPTSGYAEHIDHLGIAPLGTTGQARFDPIGAADIKFKGLKLFDARVRNNAPVVDFNEDFIVAFIEKLDPTLRLKARLRAVVGGSLGGNMAMRLGRRADLPWVKAVVPWSPAAIWPSFAAGSDPRDHLAVAIPWLLAGGDVRVVPETDVMRRLLFYYAFDWRMGIAGYAVNGKPQAEEWYRDGWSCKAARMFGARIDRHETYDAKFRLWHWRLAAEQLVFSHQLVSPETRQPLYMQNTTPMLLVCGYEDTGGKLCEHTRAVAAKMVNTPGRAFFLHDTGHSIDSERPTWLARAIVDFIEGRR